MDVETFLDRTAEHLGHLDPGRLRRAVIATLDALAALLPAPVVRSLATGLPGPLASRLAGADASGERAGVPALVARVAHRLKMEPSHAVELVAAVCRAIAATATYEAHAQVTAYLSADLAGLFTPPSEPAARPERLAPAHRAGHTLATGRPGSAHPLSEADVAQVDSIAASPEPYADTRLSSARGITQERDRRTLATARPGSSRPLSEFDD